jgi:murein DD-endopeptidase MepM/ murein hydrolase activator NlpD
MLAKIKISSVFLISLLISNLGSAQDSLKLDQDFASIDDSATVKLVDYQRFDTLLIPFAEVYENSWDSLNVNVPRFDPTKKGWSQYIDFTDSTGCEYSHPCYGKINSDFGWRRYRMHKGIDIDLEIGDSIFAAFDGIVRIQKYNYRGFGNYVMIRHYNGVETLYGHLSKTLVKPNQSVRAGQVIGLGGNTGRSSGPHLHFEMRYKGQAMNPNLFVDFSEGKLKQDNVCLDEQTFQYVVDLKKRRYYKIRPGDTLWKISRRYGTTVNRLCRLNGIRPTTTLRIGRSLRIR